jgi:hypothetical protein
MKTLEKTLDLHGMRYVDVPRAIDLFIGAHIVSGTQEIEIITGNSDQMKNMVRTIAEDYSCSIEDVWGNAGCVIINLK